MAKVKESDVRETIEDRIGMVAADMVHLSRHNAEIELVYGKHATDNTGRSKPQMVDPTKKKDGFDEKKHASLKEDLKALWNVAELEYGPLGPYLEGMTEEERGRLKQHLPQWEDIDIMLDETGSREKLQELLSVNRTQLREMYTTRIVNGMSRGEQEKALDYMVKESGLNKKELQYDLMKNKMGIILKSYLRAEAKDNPAEAKKAVFETYKHK